MSHQADLMSDYMNEYMHQLKIILTAQGFILHDKHWSVFETAYKEGYMNGQRDLLRNYLKGDEIKNG